VGCQKGYKKAAGRPPCGRATLTAVSGVAHPQGVEGLGMVGFSDTLGSPWPPLAILPCARMATSTPTGKPEWRRRISSCGGRKWEAVDVDHRRKGRDGRGLPKVSPGPALPYPSSLLCPVGGRPAAVFFPFGLPTNYI
jgi:hypothetical protein